MTEMHEAVAAILKYILTQLGIQYEENIEYPLYTHEEEIYLENNLLRRNEELASLVDAYNVLLYGKVWKHR
jgi:hypothetical protein